MIILFFPCLSIHSRFTNHPFFHSCKGHTLWKRPRRLNSHSRPAKLTALYSLVVPFETATNTIISYTRYFHSPYMVFMCRVVNGDRTKGNSDASETLTCSEKAFQWLAWCLRARRQKRHDEMPNLDPSLSRAPSCASLSH